MMNRRVAAALAAALIVSIPGSLQAQGAIAGVVRDSAGGAIAGVSVEASSPVLIEKSRTVATDEAGQYLIVDLRPGLYTVTFMRPGFSTVQRAGIELPTNFTATVNAELREGASGETIPVMAEAPVVDVRSATRQQVLSKDLLDDVPTGRSIQGSGATVSGIPTSSPDVGGAAGMQQVYMVTHGGDRRDNVVQVDGMNVNGIEGDGAIQQYFNEGMFEQKNYQTSALPADVQASSVRLNMIPKDGGNALRGSVFWSHTPGDWQSNNFTAALRATGLRAPNRVERIFDVNPSLGGPLMKDRLWFFTSFRRWGTDQTITDSFYNLDSTYRTYVPADGNDGRPLRPTVDDNVIKSGVARLTYRLGTRHKFAAYADRIVKFRGHECPAPAAEEACSERQPKLYLMAQAKYTGTVSSRTLVEFGWSQNNESYSTQENHPNVPATNIGKTDRITGERWSAAIGPYYFRAPIRHVVIGSLSYVTGSHNYKIGFQLDKGGNRRQYDYGKSGNVDLYQEYRSVVAAGGGLVRTPASVVVYNTPVDAAEYIKHDLGIYVQDSWTYKRLTLNPGLRIELFNTYLPEQGAGAGRFVPGRLYPKVENMPDWTDVAPRLGGAYDVFGDGRTALKAHVGKYVRAYSTVGFAQVYNAMTVATDRRTWTDRNGDDIAQDSEIGPVNRPFNISGASNKTADPDIRRPYQWQSMLGIQRQLTTRLSVSANWVRRDFRRLIWTDNVLVSFDDYTIVNIPNPLNASETIPIHNLDRARLGLLQEVDKNSDRNRRSYTGFDFGFTSRVGGGNVYGGATAGRQITVNCEVDDPNALRYCDHRDLDIPFLTSFKLAGTYPLPFDVQMSGSWQGYPGVPSGTSRQDATFNPSLNRVEDPSLNVNYIVDRTIVPSLVQSSVTVPLIAPGAKYLKRWNQVDLRFARKFRVRGAQVQAQFDVFNVLNSSSVLGVTETYGSRLDVPTSILQGRLFAVGAQLRF